MDFGTFSPLSSYSYFNSGLAKQNFASHIWSGEARLRHYDAELCSATPKLLSLRYS